MIRFGFLKFFITNTALQSYDVNLNADINFGSNFITPYIGLFSRAIHAAVNEY